MSKRPETPEEKATRTLCGFMSARTDWWRVYHLAIAEMRAKPRQKHLWARVASYAKAKCESLLSEEENALVQLGIILAKREADGR